MKKTEFTILFKLLRANKGYTLRALSDITGFSHVYLHDLENGNRPPTRKIAEILINVYNLNEQEKRTLYDAIAKSLGTIPFDVEDYLLNHKEALLKVISEMEAVKNNENEQHFGIK